MKVWEKIKGFCNRHRTAILVIGAGATSAFTGYYLGKRVTTTADPIIEEEALPEPEMGVVQQEPEEEWEWSFANPMLQTIIKYEEKAKEENRWFECERQRENWNKVVELAKELDPGDEEYYVIEGTNPDCNTDHATMFIHHFQGEWPSYPPETLQES